MDIYGNCFGFKFGKFTDICNHKKLATNGLVASNKNTNLKIKTLWKQNSQK